MIFKVPSQVILLYAPMNVSIVPGNNEFICERLQVEKKSEMKG